MIVVVTGMVGIDKKNYLEKVCQLAGIQGTEVVLCNVGDMMYAEAPDITASKILDISMKRLNSLRRSIFKDIIAKSKKVPNLIVNTHATFRWRHGLFPAVDFDQMRDLNADIYINMIDDIPALHRRLSDEHSTAHTLKDLIVWREEELICTEMSRNGIDPCKPLYCLARGIETETTETFYRLAFESSIKRAYLSFPMTHVADMENIKQEIDVFRRTMNQYFTCFDPGDLEEAYLPILAEKARANGEDHVEAIALGAKTRLDLDEVEQIKRDVNSQIYARDFMLIDQSDMIISYIPALADGMASISSGVERELGKDAHEAAKEVFVIWTASRAPSVFVTQTATKVFSNLDQCLEFFEKKGFIEK